MLIGAWLVWVQDFKRRGVVEEVPQHIKDALSGMNWDERLKRARIQREAALKARAEGGGTAPAKPSSNAADGEGSAPVPPQASPAPMVPPPTMAGPASKPADQAQPVKPKTGAEQGLVWTDRMKAARESRAAIEVEKIPRRAAQVPPAISPTPSTTSMSSLPSIADIPRRSKPNVDAEPASPTAPEPEVAAPRVAAAAPNPDVAAPPETPKPSPQKRPDPPERDVYNRFKVVPRVPASLVAPPVEHETERSFSPKRLGFVALSFCAGIGVALAGIAVLGVNPFGAVTSVPPRGEAAPQARGSLGGFTENSVASRASTDLAATGATGPDISVPAQDAFATPIEASDRALLEPFVGARAAVSEQPAGGTTDLEGAELALASPPSRGLPGLSGGIAIPATDAAPYLAVRVPLALAPVAGPVQRGGLETAQPLQPTPWAGRAAFPATEASVAATAPLEDVPGVPTIETAPLGRGAVASLPVLSLSGGPQIQAGVAGPQRPTMQGLDAPPFQALAIPGPVGPLAGIASIQAGISPGVLSPLAVEPASRADTAPQPPNIGAPDATVGLVPIGAVPAVPGVPMIYPTTELASVLSETVTDLSVPRADAPPSAVSLTVPERSEADLFRARVLSRLRDAVP